MPRKKESARAASGTGTLRKKTVTRNGKEYPYWEARYTVGFDPGTGKQIQRSITGKTQVGGQRACVHHRNGAAPGPAHHPAGIQAHCGLYRLSRGPLPRPAAPILFSCCCYDLPVCFAISVYFFALLQYTFSCRSFKVFYK